MVKTNKEKGDKLERAVGAIEAAIVNYNPSLARCDHKIESKKSVEVSGVKYEIDVFVEYDLGSAISSFVFECKNWKQKISHPEVSVLLSKVDAVAAQCGYLVASGITKSGRNAIKAYNGRIVFIESRDFGESQFDGNDFSPIKSNSVENLRTLVLLYSSDKGGRDGDPDEFGPAQSGVASL